MNARGKTVGVVQARYRSERLPGKVLADLGGRTALDLILERAGRAERLDELWLACSTHADDNAVAKRGEAYGVPVFRGDELDVMGRFVAVAERSEADCIVRLTADCPLADPEVIDAVAARFHKVEADFVSNTLRRSYPDGLDVEVFTRAALMRADAEAELPFLRLHVTPYIHGRLKDRLPWGEFSNEQVVTATNFSHLRWTLDEPVDLEFFRRLVPLLPDPFTWHDVIAVSTRHPELLRINRRHKTYEGTERDLQKAGQSGTTSTARTFGRSNAYFERAAASIPLASQTFSKSYQQHVQGAAPLFIESGEGCRVYDLDGNGYIDYILSLLAVILGHGDPDVDAAIDQQLRRGVSFSLPSPLEAELAERLIRLIPCAEMVRFGKNGSDVTSAAIRLARAHTSRDRVALCGYHGWQDWSIGTTTRRLGVPEAVQSLSVTFPFNDLDAAEACIGKDGDTLAAVILEPEGVVEPAPGFLAGLRELCNRHGVVLIFDEIVTGFRLHLGGAQAAYSVVPDLACFGKAMANGMPVSALVGSRDIMRRMEDIFFSTTFGGESLSLSAAIATIDKLEREAVPDRLRALGARLKAMVGKALSEQGLGAVFAIGGPDWWPRLLPMGAADAQIVQISLLRQELAARGLLVASSFNLCLAHGSETVMQETEMAFADAASAVRAAIDSNDPAACLRGRPIQPTFAVR